MTASSRQLPGARSGPPDRARPHSPRGTCGGENGLRAVSLQESVRARRGLPGPIPSVPGSGFLTPIRIWQSPSPTRGGAQGRGPIS